MYGTVITGAIDWDIDNDVAWFDGRKWEVDSNGVNIATWMSRPNIDVSKILIINEGYTHSGWYKSPRGKVFWIDFHEDMVYFMKAVGPIEGQELTEVGGFVKNVGQFD